MSRSRRRTPIIGNTTARSDKPFKVSEHRRERTMVRTALAAGEEVLPHPKSTGSWWASPKDGRHWVGDRPDAKWYPKVMRK